MAIRLQRQFVLKKLHQLTGVLPIGVFLLEHFYTNSYASRLPSDRSTSAYLRCLLPSRLSLEGTTSPLGLQYKRERLSTTTVPTIVTVA